MGSVSRVPCFLLFLILTKMVVAQGPTWHDEQSAKLAVSARDGFASATLDKNNVFQVMTANTLALEAATVSELHALNRSHALAAIQLVPTMSWNEMLSETSNEQQRILTVYSQSIRIAGLPSSATIDSAKAALDDAQSRLVTLTKEQQDLEKDASAKTLELGAMKKSLGDLRDSISKSTKPVHSLADLQEFQNLESSWKDIQDIQEWLKQAVAMNGSPGLQLTILDLAVQHQEKTVERSQLSLAHAKALVSHAAEIRDLVVTLLGDGSLTSVSSKDLAKTGLFGTMYQYLQPCTQPSTSPCPTGAFLSDSPATQSSTNCRALLGVPAEQTIVTMGRLAKAAQSEVGTCTDNTKALRNLVDILDMYAGVVGYKQFLLLQNALDITTEEQLYSISLSKINASDREILLSHGLSGLAQYYAGGITSQDIANVFQAANTIATGVIAGRIP